MNKKLTMIEFADGSRLIGIDLYDRLTPGTSTVLNNVVRAHCQSTLEGDKLKTRVRLFNDPMYYGRVSVPTTAIRVASDLDARIADIYRQFIEIRETLPAEDKSLSQLVVDMDHVNMNVPQKGDAPVPTESVTPPATEGPVDAQAVAQ